MTHRGFEPRTPWLKVKCSTAWANGSYFGWGGGIWTHAWRSQSPLPYHLATPQHKKVGWDIRVELMTSSATNWRPNQLGQSHHIIRNFISGALWGTRTSGILLRRQLLYPAELTAHIKNLERVMGIEPTRPAWKAGILPLNYTRVSQRTLLYLMCVEMSILFDYFFS